MKRVMIQMSFEAAKILGIVGGLVSLISGLYFFAFSRIAIGLIATVISGQVKHLMWSAVMIVVGIVAYTFEGGGSYWSYGPILVIAAGIIGIITHVL